MLTETSKRGVDLFEVVCYGYLQAAGLTSQYIRPSTVILEV
jgi:hypothetical protein